MKKVYLKVCLSGIMFVTLIIFIPLGFAKTLSNIEGAGAKNTAVLVDEQSAKARVNDNINIAYRLKNKMLTDRELAYKPHIILPHKMNYILPFSYTNNINKGAYDLLQPWNDKLQNMETKFQISIKSPVAINSFVEGDFFAFAFTLQSWWQVYNKDLSRPFRETNYQPEAYYFMPLAWKPAGWYTAISFGFEHQSNGRSQLMSRSWNRIYSKIQFAKDNLYIAFRPWWKIPEGNKETTLQEPANDNVDITDYMGNFDLNMTYDFGKYKLDFLGRANVKEHHGYAEVGFTFPITGRVRGYLQYINGYGESLIDYNHSQQRIGIGIALTDIM